MNLLIHVKERDIKTYTFVNHEDAFAEMSRQFRQETGFREKDIQKLLEEPEGNAHSDFGISHDSAWNNSIGDNNDWKIIEIPDAHGLTDYDPNVCGIHSVRVTFMQWAYTGHITFEIGGNCHGADLLNCDFLEMDTQEDIERYLENDCSFTYHEPEFEDSDGYYSALLKDADGNALEVYGDEEEFKKMIVSIMFTGLALE